MPHLITRGRFVLLNVVAALPVMALTIYSSLAGARSETHARDRLRGLSTNAAQRQEQIIEGARQTLAAISLAPSSVRNDPARCNEFLAKLLRAQHSGIHHAMGIYRAGAFGAAFSVQLHPPCGE